MRAAASPVVGEGVEMSLLEYAQPVKQFRFFSTPTTPFRCPRARVLLYI